MLGFRFSRGNYKQQTLFDSFLLTGILFLIMTFVATIIWLSLRQASMFSDLEYFKDVNTNSIINIDPIFNNPWYKVYSSQFFKIFLTSILLLFLMSILFFVFSKKIKAMNYTHLMLMNCIISVVLGVIFGLLTLVFIAPYILIVLGIVAFFNIVRGLVQFLPLKNYLIFTLLFADMLCLMLIGSFFLALYSINSFIDIDLFIAIMSACGVIILIGVLKTIFFSHSSAGKMINDLSNKSLKELKILQTFWFSFFWIMLPFFFWHWKWISKTNIHKSFELIKN